MSDELHFGQTLVFFIGSPFLRRVPLWDYSSHACDSKISRTARSVLVALLVDGNIAILAQSSNSYLGVPRCVTESLAYRRQKTSVRRSLPSIQPKKRR
jgi:hypothetical protein